MRIRREVVGALCALLVTACAAAAAGPDDGAPDEPISTTVGGVGVLPNPLPTSSAATERSDAETLALPTTTRSAATSTTAFRAEGNRILLLGDSILASTSRRYSNDTCKALVPLGWRVEVEAEVSRGITFANEVLKQRMSAGWDVGVVLLGANDGANSTEYLKQLNKVITSFAPRPVVLITVPEFKPGMAGINGTIRAIAEVYPDQVSVLDWNEITRSRPELLNVDGIHPTVAGRHALAEAIAAHVGHAPSEPGDCLRSVFTDDSAGSIDGGSNGKPPGTTARPRATPATTTTVKSGGGSPTTVKPVTSSTTPASSSTSAPTGQVTVVPPTTTLPVTVPPVTAPPTVASTSPPSTAGPTTTAP